MSDNQLAEIVKWYAELKAKIGGLELPWHTTVAEREQLTAASAEVERLNGELEQTKARLTLQVDYSVALQRGIENHCCGSPAAAIASGTHSEKLNADLAQLTALRAAALEVCDSAVYRPEHLYGAIVRVSLIDRLRAACGETKP